MIFSSMPFLQKFWIGQLESKILLTVTESGVKHKQIIFWFAKLWHHVVYPEDGGSVFLYIIGIHHYITQYYNSEVQNINLHCCEHLKILHLCLLCF
jgi:hypothetical protein